MQGDLSQQDKRAVFMTVHDLGCNRKYTEKYKKKAIKACKTDYINKNLYISLFR